MTKTKIPWADRVWNPVTGCIKVSQGCKNCYAESFAKRFWGERKFTDVQCHPDRLDDPTHWKKPSKIFVCSMSDLFHPAVPDSFIADVMHTIGHSFCSHHTFMILTKRPERMEDFFRKCPGETIENLWLGVSVENQDAANERIPFLLRTPAALRFISVEPMLGEVDLNVSAWGEGCPRPPLDIQVRQFVHPIGALDWVIAGCESGAGARPMDIEWARNLKDQCEQAGVPFFFKQLMQGKKLVHIPLLDGKQYVQFPEV